MEALTRLVADSLARHGLDRPIDPRRLQWSRWFRCDSPHSLLTVPSKPGIFALAEEVMDLGPAHVGTAALGCPAEQSSAAADATTTSAGSADLQGRDREGYALKGRDFQPRRNSPPVSTQAAAEPKRMLAVLQFSEDDDMAFTLDRMFTRINPMRERLASGRCFLRFVVIQDQEQRRSICSALNQWMRNSAEKASGIGADFQSSLEFNTDRVGRTLLSDSADTVTNPLQAQPLKAIQPAMPPNSHLDSGSNKNLHCPHPLPSGF
jgi:hypothetical protein